MSSKRKKNSKRPRSFPDHVTVAQPPHVRLRPLFNVLDEIMEAGDRQSWEHPGTTPDVRFDVAIYLRGLNLLKSVRLLTAEAHWESATACARQLFELLLNMEDLASSEDRDAAAMKFARFGLLQVALARIAELEYAVHTGRAVDPAHLEGARALLGSSVFEAFKGKPRVDGSPRWAQSWNGKSAGTMARESTHPIREYHYSILFTRWSEETHGAPGALVDSIFRQDRPDWIDHALSDNDRQTAQVISMAIFLYVELVSLLPSAAQFPPDKVLDWTNRIREWTISKFGLSEEDLRPPAQMEQRSDPA